MYRKLFLALNFGLLAGFLLAVGVDFKKDWRSYQSEFFRRFADSLEAQAASAKTPDEAKSLREQARSMRGQPIMLRQIIAKDLGRVDRCITCHVGMDEFVNPTLTTGIKEHPFTGHPDVKVLARNHPFQKFACTTCHGGQGIAADVEAAHGRVKFWEKPLLKQPLLQSNCAKCHADFEGLRGAETVALGRKLVEKHGCLGCHSIRGVGGLVAGVDFMNTADKPLERIDPYNFSLIRDKNGRPYASLDWKLPLWIEAHLTNDPMEFIPNDPEGRYNPEPIAPSGMQDFRKELPPGGAQAIAAYILSLTHEEKIPYELHVAAKPRPSPQPASSIERGRLVYRKYGCTGCHGLDAREGRRNFNAQGPAQTDPVKDMAKGRIPTLPDTVGTFSRDELRNKIQTGVPASAVSKFSPEGPTPPLYMPGWKDRIKDRELDDLLDFLFSVAKKAKPGEEW